jgi:hypothetical protein
MRARLTLPSERAEQDVRPPEAPPPSEVSIALTWGS